MTSVEEGVQGPSYKSAVASNPNDDIKLRPSFVSLLHLREEALHNGSAKGKAMEIDPMPTHAKAIRNWEPGKCIPQAVSAPKYVISTPRIKDQKQYMKEYTLVGKFLGL